MTWPIYDILVAMVMYWWWCTDKSFNDQQTCAAQLALEVLFIEFGFVWFLSVSLDNIAASLFTNSIRRQITALILRQKYCLKIRVKGLKSSFLIHHHNRPNSWQRVLQKTLLWLRSNVPCFLNLVWLISNPICNPHHSHPKIWVEGGEGRNYVHNLAQHVT